MSTGALLGRDTEVELVSAMLAGIGKAGSTLVLRGEPGIGKSRLLAQAGRLAGERGVAVLQTSGVESEVQLPFAGLHQLLRPVRARVANLAGAHRAVLDSAFGVGGGGSAEQFRIAMAVLDLLSDIADEAPLLVTVDDAHWLDRLSAEVMAFVARRIESDPIVVLIATREGYVSPFNAAGLPMHRLEPLDASAATALLDASGPGLSAVARSRLLREAAGNPLALNELPLALGPDSEALDPLPLTDRLMRAFAARVAELPRPTRWLLLLAAIDHQERLSEILRAGTHLARAGCLVEDLQPAADAAIIDLDLQTVRFRHPLMRAAVVHGATVAQCLRVHEALAAAWRDEPDRAVWHRAAALTGAHEDVAADLEAAAQRARGRGALDVAAAALRRAAELSDPAHSTGRLLAASALLAELGQNDAAASLLARIRVSDLSVLERARVTATDSMIDPRGRDRVRTLVEAAEDAGASGDRDLHVEMVWLVATRAAWTEPAPDDRALIVAAVARLGNADSTDPRVVAAFAHANPLGHAAGVVARLGQVTSEACRPEEARHFGAAAFIVGAFDRAAPLLRTAVDGVREEGRLGHLARGLTLYGTVAARLGDWKAAMPAADEGRRLSIEFGEPMWEAGADTVAATLAGLRGDAEAAEAAAARAERQALASGARAMVALAQVGRVLAALGDGRHGEAYDSADRLFEPDDPACHPVIAAWTIGELAEAALHCGRVEEARGRLATVEALSGDAPVSAVGLGLRHARAVLARDRDEAERRFGEALSSDLALWPFQRARLLLAHGEWLRRQRRVSDSRAALRAARDIFAALGCAAWADRARRELRASGESSPRRAPEDRDRLTAQELQIAQLAAGGLTNREIGARLYLSHRTIATHLYRVFPKLGVTARGQLGAVLGADRADD